MVDVNQYAIVLEDKEGRRVSAPLGKQFGKAAGVTYPHDLATEFKVGDSIKKGQVVTYNRKYFVPDVFNKGQVVWKAGVMCRIALVDNIATLEDGSVFSEEIAKKMNTQTTEVRTIQVRFDQHVFGLVKKGDELDIDTILCTIEDPEVAANPMFDEVSLDTLKRMSSATPRSDVVGTVSKIECFYHGDFEELSDNLKEIARQSNRERRKEAKALGQPAFDGQVDTSFRVRGNALDPDVMAIQVYIDHDVPAGTGDKFVFANQMKTVVSEIMQGKNETESGLTLDGLFGNVSNEDRMVLSLKRLGSTNVALRTLSEHVAKVGRGLTQPKRPKKS